MSYTNKRTKIFEGNRKTIYSGTGPENITLHFKDDIYDYKNDKNITVSGKGVINNRISELICSRLEIIGISTHFIKTLNMREQLVKSLEMLPFKIRVNNVITRELSEKYGIMEGLILPSPLINFVLNQSNSDSIIEEEHLISLGFSDPFEIEESKTLALRVNDFLLGFFSMANIRLISADLSFGTLQEENFLPKILLADEISPDTCKLWDLKTNEILDKERIFLNKPGIQDGYEEIAKRLKIL